MNYRSNQRSEARSLVRISNELQMLRLIVNYLTWSANIRPSTWWEIWWTFKH